MSPDPPPRRAAVVLVTPDGTPIGRLPEVPVATRWWPDVQADRPGRPRGVRDRGRRAPDARFRAAASARRRRHVPRRDRPAHRAVAARRRVPAPVRRHARRPAAPPALGHPRRPGPRPRLGRRRARGPADRAGRTRGADAQLEPVQHLAPAARGRHVGVAQGRAAVLRPRGRHAAPAPVRRRSAAPGHRRRPRAARRRRGRRPVRRGRARAARDGVHAGRPPGRLDRPRSTTCWRSACPTGGGRG